MKKPWEKYPHIWKTESAFMSYIRGGIRKSIWSRYPVKVEFIKKNRKRIPNPNPNGRVKEVWGATCYLTGETLPLVSMEVDHVKGHFSLRNMDDLQSFMEGLLYLDEDDLRFVSKEAHKIKSYAERMGITFEEARIEKEVIAICKGDEKKWLLDRGIKPESNATKRKKQVKEVLESE